MHYTRGRETRSKVSALTPLPRPGCGGPPQKRPVVPLLGRRLPQVLPAGNLSGLPPFSGEKTSGTACPSREPPRIPAATCTPRPRPLPLACGAAAAPCAAARRHPLPRPGRQVFGRGGKQPRIEFIKIFQSCRGVLARGVKRGKASRAARMGGGGTRR